MPLLSDSALEIKSLNSAVAYRRLVVHGAGHQAAKDLLSEYRPDDLFTQAVKNVDEARAAMAGLWLWHDWLPESHTISQNIHSATGSYWHAILHRREGDFSNAKYWYARCARHPVMDAMADKAASIVNASPHAADLKSVLTGGWSPAAMVDLVEALDDRTNDKREQVLVDLQRAEWEALFDLTIHAAVK